MSGKLSISVAMATYNGERFLRDQLDSIANQCLLPDELVICDDGSTDLTPRIVAEFADRAPFPVQWYPNSERLGYPDNFLRAASFCKGDLIAFSDQDDIWLKEKLARSVELFKDDAVMLVIHSGRAVDKDLQPMGFMVPHVKRDHIARPLSREFGKIHQGFAMMFRSSLPLATSRTRPRASYQQPAAMTHDQWIGFLADTFGRTAYIKDTLVFYRRHSDTITSPVPTSIMELARKSLNGRMDFYLGIAQLASEWAVYLEEAASMLSGVQSLSATRAAHHYRSIEMILRTRSRIYRSDEHVWNRILALLRLAVGPGYMRQSSAGLNARSALKDALIGVLRIDQLFGKCFL